jgi:hypothetical protein
VSVGECCFVVDTDVATAVDALLAGHHPGGEMRQRAADGTITKYTFSRDQQQQQQGAGESPLFGSRRGSSSGSSGGGRGMLPDLAAGSGVNSDGTAVMGSSSAGGGFLRRLFVSEDQARAGK